jgi:hypothetical protein
MSINPTTGVFEYIPGESEGGTIYFPNVCVSDGILSDCQYVPIEVIEVNDPPTLAPIGNQEIEELSELTFTARARDRDLPPQTLIFTLADGLSGHIPEGAAIGSASGIFTWTPTEEQGPGEYTFDICVSDGEASYCETIMVTVYEVNIAPVAEDMNVNLPEDSSIEIALAVYDDDEDPLILTILTEPTHGEFTVNGLVVTYTPDLNYNGPDSFTYKVSDGQEDSNKATVSIAVTPVNYAPLAESFEVDLQENGSVEFTLLASDVEGDLLTYSLVSGPAHGTLECTGVNCTYTPDVRWSGIDSFIFKANDGQPDSNEATVTLNLIPLQRIYLPFISR